MDAIRIRRTAAWLLAVALLTTTATGAAPKSEWNPTIDPAKFVAGVTNQYFPLPVGRILKYRGTGKNTDQTMEVEVTANTKTIMGVTTMAVIERGGANGQIDEISENWFAQDVDGTVWYFGESTQHFQNGTPTTTDGWEAGVNGAKPGIIMQANPQPGDEYFQEFSPGSAEDQAQIKSTNETTFLLQSSQSGVLLTREWTRLEPNSREKKYFAPGIGLVIEEKGPERLELVQIIG